jgi:uncharacterized protein
MGQRTSHPPGTFSWTDLATSDVDGAKRFYGELLGWEFDDQPIPEGGVYSMALRDGGNVAALYQPQTEMPPAWVSYVTVTSADDAAARARDVGGTLMTEPFDVLTAGRMTVIQDPTGAVVAAWEPRESIGATLVNGPGALTLNQLNTSDPERGRDFYAQLFGWRIEPVPGGDQPYWGIYNDERLNGGMMHLQPDAGAPSHWLVYFGSAGVDEDATKVTELGGQVLVPPLDVPGGRVAVAQDPHGAFFGLVSGRFDD